MPHLKRDSADIYYITTKNIQLQKETIIFLNSVMTTTTSFIDYQKFFESRGYNVVCHNYRGQLKSTISGNINLDHQVDDLIALIEHLKLASVHLVGVSYGGVIALKTAIKISEKIKSMSLVTSFCEVTPRLVKILSIWSDLARLNDPKLFLEGIFPFVYSPEYLRKHSDLLENTIKEMEYLDSTFYQGQIKLYQALMNLDELALNTTHIKTLIVSAEEDLVTTKNDQEKIYRSLEYSEWISVPNSGHGLIFEQPDTLLSIIYGFISKLNKEDYDV